MAGASELGGFAPIAGEIKDGGEVLLGRDSNGNPLSLGQRGLTLVGFAVPFVPGSWFRRIGKRVWNALPSFRKAASHVDEATALGKEAAEKVTEATAEKTAKEVAEATAEKSAKEAVEHPERTAAAGNLVAAKAKGAIVPNSAAARGLAKATEHLVRVSRILSMSNSHL